MATKHGEGDYSDAKIAAKAFVIYNTVKQMGMKEFEIKNNKFGE